MSLECQKCEGAKPCHFFFLNVRHGMGKLCHFYESLIIFVHTKLYIAVHTLIETFHNYN